MRGGGERKKVEGGGEVRSGVREKGAHSCPFPSRSLPSHATLPFPRPFSLSFSLTRGILGLGLNCAVGNLGGEGWQRECVRRMREVGERREKGIHMLLVPFKPVPPSLPFPSLPPPMTHSHLLNALALVGVIRHMIDRELLHLPVGLDQQDSSIAHIGRDEAGAASSAVLRGRWGLGFGI